jgi:hypothetical protein
MMGRAWEWKIAKGKRSDLRIGKLEQDERDRDGRKTEKSEEDLNPITEEKNSIRRITGKIQIHCLVK